MFFTLLYITQHLLLVFQIPIVLGIFLTAYSDVRVSLLGTVFAVLGVFFTCIYLLVSALSTFCSSFVNSGFCPQWDSKIVIGCWAE